MKENEIDKMRRGESPDFASQEIQASFRHCKILLSRFNVLNIYSGDYRDILRGLIPGIPASAVVVPPFHCDHGHGISIGEHVFVNSGCTFLDGAMVTIGAYSLIGPNVQIYTPTHPLEALARRTGEEHARPVTIGEDCWIGGGAIICPGVTIGARSVVGAGSVVTTDIPPDSVAMGNPARVVRTIVQ